MGTKDLCSIREWAPLAVIERIPSHFSRLGGLFSLNLNITCVAAVEDFIALGSDVGVVFWYNRQTGDVQKLRAEVPSRITCVKIVNSVEYMVAAGHASGQVSVFQIQKPLPLDVDIPCCLVRRKPIQRYTIRDLHRSGVSCCEFSRNGMKLYSGDRTGIVVATEFDFTNYLSKSQEILSEAYEIVQICALQSYLLVSTIYRSVLCQRSDVNGEWQILQVGKKDRKLLVDCGGTFLRRRQKQPTQIICARPGLRFWLADLKGHVEKTLLFREALAQSPTWEIPILNPKTLGCGGGGGQTLDGITPPLSQRIGSSNNIPPIVEGKNFSQLFVYDEERSGENDALIVTHDGAVLYILNVDSLRVEAIARGFRKILDFCVCGQEIFILEGERSLLRLAPMPEKPNRTSKIVFNPFMPPPVPSLGLQPRIYGKCESPIECEPLESSKGRTPSLTTTAKELPNNIGVFECLELPAIATLQLSIPIELAVESPRAEQNRRLQLFNRIGEQEFDNSILHHSGGNGDNNRRLRRKSREKPKSGIIEIGQTALKESEENNPTFSIESKVSTETKVIKSQIQSETLTTAKPIAMDASFCTSSLQDEILDNESVQDNVIGNEMLSNEMLSNEKLSNEMLSDESNHKSLTPPPTLAPACTPATPTRTTSTDTKKEDEVVNLEKIIGEYIYNQSSLTSLEDAGVQTTPQKKFPFDPLLLLDGESDGLMASNNNSSGIDSSIVASGFPADSVYDFSNGRPVDEMCSLVQYEPIQLNAECVVQSPQQLKFISTQVSTTPLETQHQNSGVDGSFLPDFANAADPFKDKLKKRSSQPPSGDSTNSSEWEFLDN